MEPTGGMGAIIVPELIQDPDRVRALTRQMAQGNEDAFLEFHRLYSDRLFRFLLVLTRGGEDISRELCQGTMINVVRSIREFETEKHLWNWLTRIARNLFIDALRKTQRSPKIVPFPAEETFAQAHEPPADDPALIAALEESLSDLDFEDRRLVEEYYFDGRDQKTMADERFTTPKAVESRLARVRAKLRTVLLSKL